MTKRKICVMEVTTVAKTDAFTVTCTTPAHTPCDCGCPGECNIALYNVAFTTTPYPTISYSYDVQWKYSYMQSGTTFEEFCNVYNQSKSITFDSLTTTCCGLAPSITSSCTCNCAGITTTPTSVAGPVSFAFTINNLCAQTVICIDDTTGCP